MTCFVVLDMRDMKKVKTYLKTLQKQDVIDVGISLGLDYNKLSDAGADKNSMISSWLNRQDYVMETTGIPTLRNLISALRENQLNGNVEEIEKDNPMTSTATDESCKLMN